MHILGKILTWLVLIAAVPAIMLAAKLLDIQTSWSDKVDKIRVQNEQQAETLAGLERDLKEVRDDVALTSMGWGRYWVSLPQRPINVNVVNRQTGEISASIGTNNMVVERIAKDDSGADVRFLPTLYAFQTMGQDVQYVGSFQVQTLRENQITMTPDWRFRPGEADAWQNGTTWHFRADIPVSHKARIDGLLANVELTARTIADKQIKLQTQETLRSDAEQKLGYRNEQLVGPATPPTQESLPLEFRIGLSPAIESYEEQRNREQAELDRLRHLVKQTSDRLNDLIQQNDKIVKSLSEPENARLSSR